ncbi:hypothetical protein DSO57_1033467 [Entomophthora muscae]|uniref:Uncharacterized protein n=1 Tax=Entomophthora muscae TaxID=34485 RepID=A0ACC2TAY1_9FUNG|nr:hypothetical protein DSO57_1033467 [Entomophthora muscae]
MPWGSKIQKQKDGQSLPPAFRKAHPYVYINHLYLWIGPDFQPLYGIGWKVKGYRHISYLKEPQKVSSVTEVTVLKPWAGIEPAPCRQAGQAGGRDLPAPGFASKSKNSGVGIIPALATAVGPILGPKSYAQALVRLAGPGQAIFSCPVNPVQAHPSLRNPVKAVQNGDQIGKNSIAPEAKPAKINDQPSQDEPPKSQTTVLENPENDLEAANQTAEPEVPSLATQTAPEE